MTSPDLPADQVLDARAGRVREFDAARGWGAIEADDGTRFEFHCTQIADGTRTIPVDVPVRFRVRPGQLGRWEATAITQA